MTDVRTMTEAQAVVDRLVAGEAVWSATSLSERIRLLREMQVGVAAHSAQWVDVACRIKQLPAQSQQAGEEWLGGPYVVLEYLPALAQTLERLRDGRDVLAGYPVVSAPGDRIAVQVSPHGAFQYLLFSGYRTQVWMAPGVTLEQARAGAGLAERWPTATHGVAVVLGAGNAFSIPVLDVLYQLFAENRSVLLKLNPITDPLLGVFTRVLAPFIELGVVEIVTGGAASGALLTDSPDVAAVHMTGSEATHDAIVWGPGQEGQRAKAAGAPRLDKPVTSELGGVSPVIIVPDRWSTADLRFQAQNVASMRLHNSGCNCVAGQVVILSSDWPQKDAFLAELRAALTSAPQRPGWYPGCDDRVAAARDLHPDATLLASATPRLLLTGLDLTDPEESAFSTEYFSPVLGVAELPGTGGDFLDAAVTAANERLHGTLGANIIIEPATRKRLGPRFDESIAHLRYGCVAVNVWTAFAFMEARATWGAFPGHRADDIQSGTGVVHNALLLQNTERTVVTGPFRPFPQSVLHGEMSMAPTPTWYVTNRTAATTGRRVTQFAAQPRWRSLPAIFASALRG